MSARRATIAYQAPLSRVQIDAVQKQRSGPDDHTGLPTLVLGCLGGKDVCECGIGGFHISYRSLVWALSRMRRLGLRSRVWLNG